MIIDAGQLQQLPTTDALLIRDGGIFAFVQNNNASTLPPGTPVYIVSAGVVDKARANNIATAKVAGLTVASIASAASGFIQLSGRLTLTTTEWDAIFGDLSTGLAANSDYYLAASSAGIAADTVEDSTGNWHCRLGRALNSTTFFIQIDYPIGL